MGGVGEILDLLGHGDSCNRHSDDIRSGLAAGFREKVPVNVSNAGDGYLGGKSKLAEKEVKFESEQIMKRQSGF